MFGVTTISGAWSWERRGPAVTGVAGHDAEIIGEEFLLSDPFGDDGTERRRFVNSANITGATTVNRLNTGR